MKAKLTKEWGWDCNIVSEGTEVTIIKGMEADAADVINAPYGMCYLCELDGIMSYVPATYLTITDWDNTNWEQRRYEIAKEAMLHMIDPKMLTQKYGLMAVNAVEFADSLIAELKKKNKVRKQYPSNSRGLA